ncbi:MAG: LacI family DNA-binding transcriptional regulator [Actinobacteria bacterium]|nr:LacI family DNA-binding transcriptional regulator [Actinomycetota bacterium]MBS1900323.1 LacI family DNA-binding transcriptional regulator [Actinomycetota bacterium]
MTGDRIAGATIRDVARAAGVSATTVSRSLRGMSNVASDTRERIERAATELGYRLPRAAAGRPVAVVARYPAQWFFAESIATVERTLRGSDHDVLLFGAGDVDGRRNLFHRLIENPGIAGVIVVATSFDPAERASLDALGVPVVVVGGYVPGLPRVGIDDVGAARMATQHLLALGHRDIGVVSFAPDDVVGHDTTSARLRGFEEAMRSARVPVQSQWVLARESTIHGGVLAAGDLLSLPALPTGLVAMSDEMALGALWTLRRAGIVVPGAMSIVGFDDNEMAAGSDLTTIHQPVTTQAERAAAHMLTMIDGGVRDVIDVDLPVRLVVRGSTGPAAAAQR